MITYNSKRGFFYTHYGWLFEKAKYNPKYEVVNLKDLRNDIVVNYQLKLYPYLVVFFYFIFPTVLGSIFYNNGYLGFLYIGCVARFISWNAIFFVNSYCHWKGDRNYNDEISASTSFILGLASMGESYHNSHHHLCKDYRHGIEWYDLDPTKIILWILNKIGIVNNLYTYDDHIVKQSKLLTKINNAEKNLINLKNEYKKFMLQAIDTEYYTPNVNDLPLMSYDTFILHCELDENNNHIIFIIDNIVYDVTKFANRHPGGKYILKTYHKKDATNVFNDGTLNIHSKAAKLLMARYAIARMIINKDNKQKLR